MWVGVKIENGVWGGFTMEKKNNVLLTIKCNVFSTIPKKLNTSETPYMNYYLKSDLKRVPDGILGVQKGMKYNSYWEKKCNWNYKFQFCISSN